MISKVTVKSRTTGYYEDVYIDFFKKATKIQNQSGTIYALHFEVDSGATFSLLVDTFIIPEGSSLVISDKEGNIYKKFRYDAKSRRLDNKEVIVVGSEFVTKKEILMSITFQEDIPISGFKITIYNIGINIFNFKTANINNINKSPTISPTLKSSMINSSSCYFDVGCMSDYTLWINDIFSVVQLVYLIKYLGDEFYIYGTGFFVNSMNYNNGFEIYPFLLTAGHLFYDSRPGKPFVYLGNYVQNSAAFYACQITDCNNPNTACFANIEDINILKCGAMSYLNDISNDYALLQTSQTMSDLETTFNFTFAGFTSRSFTYTELDNNKPYRIFHIPRELGTGRDDLKQYLISNFCPVDNGTYYTLYPDPSQIGYTHEGSSGAPVFNNDHKVIGISITGENTCSNPVQSPNDFCKLSLILQQDPFIAARLGNNAYTFNPLYINLPQHCYNCVLDANKGEIDVDCGGKCGPCSDVDDENIAYTESTDLLQEAKTTKSIIIDGTNEGISKTKAIIDYTAKEGIEIKGQFYADKDVSLVARDFRPWDWRTRRELCDKQIFNYDFYMNGGKPDALYIQAAFTAKYKIEVFLDYNGEKIFESSINNVYTNEPFVIYRGENVPTSIGSPVTLDINLVLWDLKNIQHNFIFHVLVFVL